VRAVRNTTQFDFYCSVVFTALLCLRFSSGPLEPPKIAFKVRQFDDPRLAPPWGYRRRIRDGDRESVLCFEVDAEEAGGG